jgi:nitrite reductase (NO-forming)
MSRKTVPVGKVIFTVVNKGKIGHDFVIAGKKTPVIAPGKKATLLVVFKKKRRYVYLCSLPGHAAAGMKGTLAVGIKAPTGTTTASSTTTTYPGPGGTVTVSMFEFGFTLSPSTVPSGNVTFVMNNTGTVVHNFDIEGVQPGPFVDPGKSATMTVNLQAGRQYTYVCDVPYHAQSGMEGTFTPAG